MDCLSVLLVDFFLLRESVEHYGGELFRHFEDVLLRRLLAVLVMESVLFTKISCDPSTSTSSSNFLPHFLNNSPHSNSG